MSLIFVLNILIEINRLTLDLILEMLSCKKDKTNGFEELNWGRKNARRSPNQLLYIFSK